MSGRALLIGVSEYDSDAIPDLEFVSNDLASLGEVFDGNSYKTTVLGAKRSPTHNSIIHGVNQFCRHEVEENEVAVIYFSGHGLNHRGRDYLVPSDATLGDEIIEQVMVPLDFTAAYQQSRAAAIFFFIDACREGVDMGEKSLGYQEWSKGKLEVVSNQHTAHIFACGPGEVSRYVAGADGFSLFSRALADVLGEPRSTIPLTFGRMRTEVQKRVDELADDHQKPRQGIRVVSESAVTDGDLMSVLIATSGSRTSSLPHVDVEAIGELSISTEDLQLLSYSHDGKAPWIEGKVPVLHVLRTASALDKPVRYVLDRLRLFEPVGVTVPSIDLKAAGEIQFDQDDLVLLPSGRGEGRYGAAEVSAIHALYAANQLGIPMDEVLEKVSRFAKVGVKPPGIDPAAVRGLMVDERDLRMLSEDIDGRPPWLQGEVPVTHILATANALKISLGEVVDRLKDFAPCGIAVSLKLDGDVASRTVSDDDLRLISERLNGVEPWVEPSISIGHVLFVASEEYLTVAKALDLLLHLEPFGFKVPSIGAGAGDLMVTEGDLVLLSRDMDGQAPWLEGVLPPARLLAGAHKLGESVGRVCDRIQRFAGFGFRHVAVDREAVEDLVPDDDDMFLVSGGEKIPPAALMNETIPIGHILWAAHRFNEPIDRTADRVRRVEAAGIVAPSVDWEQAEGLRVSKEDLQMFSSDLDGRSPWLQPDVTPFHLLSVASGLEVPLGEVMERMKKFEAVGYSIPDLDKEAVSGLQVTHEDLIVLSRDWDAAAPWIGDEDVSTIHLMAASSELEEPIGDVIERLRRFEAVGVTLPEVDPEVLSVQVQEEDLDVLSEDVDGEEPWISGQIPVGNILYAAHSEELVVGKVVERLRQFEGLGFVLPELDERATKLRIEEEDLILISQDLDAEPPWVEQSVPVMHLLRVANALGEPVGATLERVRRLGPTGAISLAPSFSLLPFSARRRFTA